MSTHHPHPSESDRILATPSAYAKSHYLYVQEVGSLKSLRPHISSRQNLHSYLFFLVTSGNGTLSYQGNTFTLRQGDCAWIDCATPYAHESNRLSPWELKWVHFDGISAQDFYQAFLSQGSENVFSPGNPALFNECLSSLLALYKKNASHRELFAHKYLTDLCTFCFSESKSKTLLFSSESKLLDIREYLYSHYAEKISLDDLASLFFISKYHLVREYGKHFGITPASDLINCRISHAKELLRFGTQSIESISTLCGFRSPSYFIRAFKRAENMTPLEYRRKW